MNIGDFGTPPEPVEEHTFGWFGATVRVNPDFGYLDYVEFMATAGGVSVGESAAAGSIKEFARLCVHQDDFAEFWRLARANRQQVEDIFAVCRKVVEVVAERPTGRSSDSSDGPSTTLPSSGGDDFSVAMAANEGRPDRQLAIVRAHEARTA